MTKPPENTESLLKSVDLRIEKKRVSLGNLDESAGVGTLPPPARSHGLSLSSVATTNVVESCEKCCHAQFLAEAEFHLLRPAPPPHTTHALSRHMIVVQ